MTADVYSFLDSHISPDDWHELDETQDAQLLWMTARALNTDVEEIADDVRRWRRDVHTRQPQLDGRQVERTRS